LRVEGKQSSLFSVTWRPGFKVYDLATCEMKVRVVISTVAVSVLSFFLMHLILHDGSQLESQWLLWLPRTYLFSLFPNI